MGIDVDERVVSIGLQDKTLKFKVVDDFDGHQVSSLEYYMIDFDPLFDWSSNVKSFVVSDNETYSTVVRCPKIDGDVYDIVDEH